MAWRLWLRPVRRQRSSSGIADTLASGPAGGNVPVPQLMKSSRLAKQFPFTSKSLFPPSHNMEWKPPVFYVLTLSLCFTNHQTLCGGVGGVGGGVDPVDRQRSDTASKIKGLVFKARNVPLRFVWFFFFLGAEGICEGVVGKNVSQSSKLGLCVCERRVNLISTIAEEGVFQNAGLPLVGGNEVWVALHFATSPLGATKSSTLDS